MPREIARALESGEVGSRRELERLKRALASRAGAGRVPTDAEVLSALGDRGPPEARRLLVTKPSRSLSGVTAVAVMAPPHRCPHGRCLYCPGGVESGTPQSYTGDEPAARRGARHGYDPVAQTADRIAQLQGGGHPTDKVELVLMGGTFPAIEEGARSDFVRGCLEALNGSPAGSLGEAMDANEAAPRRCVALTVETRPDLCDEAGVDSLLGMGVTRVEVGVQTTEDAPLELVERGHGVRESREATRALKDAGLKVGYHMMLGLPGMDVDGDVDALLRVVSEEAFMPDLLKLYPTLVIEGTWLHDQWQSGAYRPYDEATAVEVLSRVKPQLPPWVRVSRVERDIPSDRIAAGVGASNLRQLVARRLEEQGKRCGCIRCREVGRRGTERLRDGGAPSGTPELSERRYRASGGEEAFLSLELAPDGALVGYARVRRPSSRAWRPELVDAAVLREVRVLGEALPLGASPVKAAGSLQWQHRGHGRRLLAEAERVAREWSLHRLAVTAGMGARGYFRAQGYHLEGPYMVRELG